MSSKPNKPCIVLGVTGGIAVYKACEVLRLLQKQGIDVYVVMTKNACQFVAPLTFETLSGHPVAVDTFERQSTWEVEHIALAVLNQKKDMGGLRLMVTAGPTREAIDPVRYISNRSSGKMGYAIAAAAAARGADVTLLTGPVAIEAPAGVKTLHFTTTKDLLALALEHAPNQDVIIQAAAPADYCAKEIAPQKIKKQGGEAFVLEMVENPDVAATIGKAKKEGQTFVGFAAETNDVLEHAQGKLHKKNLDMIVANDVTAPGAGFDVDTNIVTFVTKEETISLPMLKKSEVADRILDQIQAIRKK